MSAYDLNEVLIRHPSSTFFLRVSGDSMVEAGIQDGDLLVVDRSLDARPGQVVVAVLDGSVHAQAPGAPPGPARRIPT